MADEPVLTNAEPGREEAMVPVFSSSNHDAEMEAMNIHSILQASGIPSVLVGASTIPSLEFQVQVPRADADEARRLLEEATAAGPEAAEQAERASEDTV